MRHCKKLVGHPSDCLFGGNDNLYRIDDRTQRPVYGKTTFAVMGRGVDANAASSLSATYEMAQKFEAILENTILKKKK